MWTLCCIEPKSIEYIAKDSEEYQIFLENHIDDTMDNRCHVHVEGNNDEISSHCSELSDEDDSENTVETEYNSSDGWIEDIEGDQVVHIDPTLYVDSSPSRKRPFVTESNDSLFENKDTHQIIECSSNDKSDPASSDEEYEDCAEFNDDYGESLEISDNDLSDADSNETDFQVQLDSTLSFDRLFRLTRMMRYPLPNPTSFRLGIPPDMKVHQTKLENKLLVFASCQSHVYLLDPVRQEAHQSIRDICSSRDLRQARFLDDFDRMFMHRLDMTARLKYDRMDTRAQPDAYW
jgi:hypothetical protein